MLATIPLDLIDIGDRLRSLNGEQVAALVASIAEVGLLNPVTVYERRVIRDNITVAGYGVVCGAHRVEACRQLGLAEIEATVAGLSDLQRQIAECDENLCGAKLTPSERAVFVRRRKEAYEALHPETRHGANQHTGRSPQLEDSSSAERFTKDAAAKIGRSEQSIQRDAERGAKIAENVMAMLKGTPLDNGTYLDKLKKLSHDAQFDKVDRDLRALEEAKHRPQPRRSGKLAADPLSDGEAVEHQVAKLMSAWNSASPEAREVFLGRIDRSVFDSTCAGRAA